MWSSGAAYPKVVTSLRTDVACSARGWLRRSLRGTRAGSPPVPRATSTMSRASIQPLAGEPGDEARVARAPEAVRAERDEGAVGDVVVDGEVGVAGEGDHALDAGTPRLDALPRPVDGGEVAARGLAEDFRDGVHAIHPTRRVPPAPVGVHLLAPAHRPGG